MQAHEVPTHVQAEDRVLLWFTFPQIVALTAVAALAYGAYSLAPFGPSGVRLALAILIALAGVAAVAGKIGGRRLPLVAADLLRFWLGPRRYAGVPAELARGEPPPPPPSTPNPLQLLVKRTRRGLRKLRKKRRRSGRKPFRPHCRFGKRLFRRQGESGNGHRVDIRSVGQRGGLVLLAVSVAVTTVFGVMALWSQPASADGHEQWFGEELTIPEPVPGQRLFVERLSVSGDWAGLTLRVATDLQVHVRAYGGSDGETLVFRADASLTPGARSTRPRSPGCTPSHRRISIRAAAPSPVSTCAPAPPSSTTPSTAPTSMPTRPCSRGRARGNRSRRSWACCGA